MIHYFKYLFRNSSLTLILIALKFFISLHQLQIAKKLNGEPPLPNDINKFFTPSTSTKPQIRSTDLELQRFAKQPQPQNQTQQPIILSKQPQSQYAIYFNTTLNPG